MIFSFNTNAFELHIPDTTFISPWYYGGGDVLKDKRFMLSTFITIFKTNNNKFNVTMKFCYSNTNSERPCNINKLEVIFETDVAPGNLSYEEIKIIKKDGVDIVQNNILGQPLSFTIKILGNISFDKCAYKMGDTYKFITSKVISGHPSMQAFFTREQRIDKNDACSSSQLLLKKNNIFNTIKVPSIFIDFQTLIDGSDIGNTILEVTDKFQYYNHKTTPIISNYNCQVININDPKITRFDKSCPKIVSVLKGIGETAYDKISYLHDDNIIDFYDFYINLVKYSMTKYLLSRIMYGQFNIKYVLNKYNNKFLKDLRNTRFCNFVNEFTNPNSDIFGYEQYFL